MTAYPAISLWQPWASLLFTGNKIHETRHWPAPARVIGKRVLIHAAKTREGLDGSDSRLDTICILAFGRGYEHSLPRGAFLGTVRLTESFQIADMVEASRAPAGAVDEACGNWAPGRFAWKMDEPILFAMPIPARGHQGWWTAEVDQ